MKYNAGFAFLLALFLILFISLLFVAMFNLLTTDLQIAYNQTQDAQALYIAEAGIEDAIYNLQMNDDWTADAQETIFPTASGNRYIVTRLAGSDTIESIGRLSDGYEKEIEARVLVSGADPPHTVQLIGWEEAS